MIAVWLVVPPSSVARREHPRRVEPGGVGRRQVVGEQHRRLVGRRDARLGLPDELGDDPARTSRRSVTRSAISPPMLREHRPRTARRRRARWRRSGAPASSCLLDRRAQPLVAGQPGGGGEHLGAPAPAAPVGPARRSPSATGRRRPSSYAAERGRRRRRTPPSPNARDRRAGRRPRRGRTSGRGREATPRDDRGAAAGRARSRTGRCGDQGRHANSASDLDCQRIGRKTTQYTDPHRTRRGGQR